MPESVELPQPLVVHGVGALRARDVADVDDEIDLRARDRCQHSLVRRLDRVPSHVRWPLIGHVAHDGNPNNGMALCGRRCRKGQKGNTENRGAHVEFSGMTMSESFHISWL